MNRSIIFLENHFIKLIISQIFSGFSDVLTKENL